MKTGRQGSWAPIVYYEFDDLIGVKDFKNSRLVQFHVGFLSLVEDRKENTARFFFLVSLFVSLENNVDNSDHEDDADVATSRRPRRWH